MEDFISTVPPQNLEAEISILGALLLDNSMISTVNNIISPEDFYKAVHRKIYEAIQIIHEREEPLDLLILHEVLKERGDVDKVGGPGFVASLADGVPTAANVAYYAEIVKEKAIRRAVISRAQNLLTSAYEEESKTEDLVEVMKQDALDISFTKSDVPSYTMKEVVASAFNQIELANQEGKQVIGVPYGFSDLDRLTAGAMPGDLVVVAGRPSMGKSLFTGEVVMNSALAGHPAALFSAEMIKEQYGKRVLSAKSKIPYTAIRTGKLKSSDWPLLTKAASIISEAPIYIIDKGGLTLRNIISKAENLKLEHDIKSIAVDYLQLVKVKYLKGRNREQEVSLISYEMKQLAKRLEIPVFLLSQLNREVERRPDKRPILSDLRESGSIEQDADVVLLLYRPGEYFNDSDIPKIYKGVPNPPKTIKNTLECTIAKGRDVGTGTVILHADLPIQSITDEEGELF